MGRPHPLHDWTTALAEYRDHLVAMRRATNTVREYVGNTGIFARWCIRAGYGALTWGRPQYEAFEADLAARNTSVARQAGYRVAVGLFTKWLIRRGVRTGNPLESMPPLTRVPTPPVRVLTSGQQAAIMRALEGDSVTSVRTRCLARLILQTGLRASEAIGLKIDDIRRDDHGHFLVIRGKGGKTRHVPLNVEATEALREWIQTRRNTWPHSTQRALWLTASETPLTYRHAHKSYQKATLDAGIPREVGHFHTLRHTFATRLCQSGTPIQVVADLLGHESIEMTRSRYVASDPVAMRQAVASLGSLPLQVDNTCALAQNMLDTPIAG